MVHRCVHMSEPIHFKHVQYSNTQRTSNELNCVLLIYTAIFASVRNDNASGLVTDTNLARRTKPLV